LDPHKVIETLKKKQDSAYLRKQQRIEFHRSVRAQTLCLGPNCATRSLGPVLGVPPVSHQIAPKGQKILCSQGLDVYGDVRWYGPLPPSHAAAVRWLPAFPPLGPEDLAFFPGPAACSEPEAHNKSAPAGLPPGSTSPTRPVRRRPQAGAIGSSGVSCL